MNTIPPNLDASYRALFEAHPRPMWVYDRNTLAFLAVNDAALQTYGYSRNEFLAMTIKDIRPPEDIPALLDDIARLTQGVDAPDVWRHRRKDGTLIAVEITSHPIQFDDRQARLVLVIDVTERQRAIQTLERQRQEAEILAELGRALNASLDLPAILQQVAEGAKQLCEGDGAAIALREPDADAMVIRHWAGRPYHGFAGVRIERGQGIGGLVLATGRPQRTEDYAADPQLSKEHLSVVRAGRAVGVLAVPIRLEERVEGVIYVGSLHLRAFTDDDEALVLRLADLAAVAIRNAQLYQTQEQRRRAAERLASTAQLLAQSLDPQEVAQRIVDCVRELLQARSATLFEVDPASGDFRVRTVAGDVRPAFAPRMLLPAGTGVAGLAIRERRPVVTANLLTDPHVVFSPETRARIAQAPYRAVLAVPLVSHDQVTGALGVTDQEGRRFTPEEIELVQSFAHQATTALNNASLYQKTQHAYRELTRTQEQLTQAKKMEAVGQLAGGVAHDFNNLLTVITGRAQLLLMGLGPSDPGRRDLELIQHAANRAAALTQQLLAYGRKQTLQPQMLDLNARVTHLSLMLRRLMGEDIALVTTLDPTLKRVKVDPGQFDQVLLNLAVNARDAMPQGGRLAIDTANVTLEDTAARQHPQVLPGAYVRLSVRDTGVGMDTETQSHLFEPFFTTKGLGKGTGLGLATVYGIVTQSGGAIGVDSAPGQGATFTIYLPPADEEPEDQTSAAS